MKSEADYEYEQKRHWVQTGYDLALREAKHLERARIVAWLRSEADAYGMTVDGRQTAERLTALELADVLERGEHE